MRAEDIDYETDDRVRRTLPWGGIEYGTVIHIPDGEDIGEVIVLTEDDQAIGIYAPEEWYK